MRRALAWVGLGSGLGGVSRVLVAELALRICGSGFPWGVLTVNLFGSALTGMLAALTASGGRWLRAPEKRLFLMTGFCGGFTTFSFFSLQTLELLQTDRPGVAAFYSAVTLVGSVCAAWVGFVSVFRR